MADESYINVDGARATHVQFHQPSNGPARALVTLEDLALNLAANVTLQVGSAKFKCKVSPEFGGTHALAKKVALILGGGGWGQLLPSKTYPNDAGVKSLTIVNEVCGLVGETLGTFEPRVKIHPEKHVRRAGPASQALEDATGGTPWRVDRNGVTHVGLRTPTPAPKDAYELLEYSPETRIATLAFQDLTKLDVGSVLTSDRLDAPQTIQAFDLEVTGETSRMYAYCGTSQNSTAEIQNVLRAIVNRTSDRRIWGKWRYRVVKMAGRRVSLQAVNRSAGLPDIPNVRMHFGLPGSKATLTEGSIVTVEFLEGDPDLPRVTGYAGDEDARSRAVELVLGGEENAQEIACKGDTVKCPLPPAVLSGTALIGGTPTPITGVVQFSSAYTVGQITTGTNRGKFGRG